MFFINLHMFIFLFSSLCLFWFCSGNAVVKHELETGVVKISKKLSSYVNTHLGVEHLQKHLTKLTKNAGQVDGNSIVEELEDELSGKTKQASLALKELKLFIIKSNAGHGDERQLQSCCTYDGKTKFSTAFNASVNFNDICEYGATGSDKLHLLEKQDAIKTFKSVFQKYGIGSSRHLYYGGKDGYFIAYPAQNTGRDVHECKMFDPRYRPWYIDTINNNVGKEIIFLIDYSFKMKTVEWYLKKVASHILGIVDSRDKIFLKTLPSDAEKLNELPCLNDLADAHTSVTNELRKIIQDTKVSDEVLTNLHLEETFKKFNNPNKEKYFIFVTSGDYPDPPAVKLDFEKAIKKWNCSVSINIILISDGDIGGVTNKIYNFHDGDLTDTDVCDKKNNQLISLPIIKETTTDVTIRDTIAKVFDSFYASHSNKQQSDDVKFVMPYDDFYGLGNMIDACTRVVNSRKEFLGVLCVSYLKDELLGITSDFVTTDNQYRFLIDDSGTTLVHPNYANPGLYEHAVRFDITNFETSEGFRRVYPSMKSLTIPTQISVPSGLFGAAFEHKNYTYYWKKVENSFLTIGVVLSEKNKERLKLIWSKEDSEKSDDVYHRFDIYKDRSSFCRNGDKLAIKGPTFKIPDSAFTHFPNDSMGINTKENILKFSNFFNGLSQSTDKIKSVAMAAQLKTSVQVTREIDRIWLSNTGEESQTINSRYIAFDNGVMRMFPGQALLNYDPTVQPWYKIAHSHSDESKLFFTPPFSFSTKRLLTVSTELKRIYKEHSEKAGVMAMDFELPYFKQILDAELSDQNTKDRKDTTIIISQSGFIVYHPDFLDKDLPFERNTHLIEKEPYIAKSLMDGNFMKKSYCIEYNNTAPKVTWFYTLVPLSKATEVGSYCPLFWIVSIPNTNLLVLKIIQKECKTDKCPCGNKPLDGSLPECESSDVQYTCECPCFVKNVCFSSLPPRNESLICQPKQNNIRHDTKEHTDLKDIDQCFNKECSKRRDKRKCEKVGCRFNETSTRCVEWVFPKKHQKSDDKAISKTTSSKTASIGIKIGIAVGVIVIVSVIVLIIVLWKKRTLTKHKPTPPPAHYHVNGGHEKDGVYQDIIDVDVLDV